MIEIAKDHMKTYEEELKEYDKAKLMLPILKQMATWFEEIFEFVQKKGRLS